MIKRLILCFSALIMTITLLCSCQKEEGKGGQATLEGKVVKRELYTNPLIGAKDSIVAEYPESDARVYIVYGDGDIYDDDFRTDYKGEYKFEGLRTGNYTVYAVQDCVGDDCEGKEEPVQQTVEITDKKGTTEVPTIYINEDVTNN